jgi:hypothetical protein
MKEEVTSLSQFGKALLLTNRSHETFVEQAPLGYVMPLPDNLPKRVLHKLNIGAWGAIDHECNLFTRQFFVSKFSPPTKASQWSSVVHWVSDHCFNLMEPGSWIDIGECECEYGAVGWFPSDLFWYFWTPNPRTNGNGLTLAVDTSSRRPQQSLSRNGFSYSSEFTGMRRFNFSGGVFWPKALRSAVG